jgi:chemotaxis protein CheZ
MSVDKNLPILIVDDYKTMLRIIRNLLKQIGFDNVNEATNAIMNAAERIDQVRGVVDASMGATLGEAVTAIYEACGFQDITGQRITKVAVALKHIDEKVTALLAALRGEIARYKDAKPSEKEPTQVPAEKDVLYGPQLATDAKTQAEIGALLANLG